MMLKTRIVYSSLLIIFFSILVFFPVWTILTWAEEPRGLVVTSKIVDDQVPVGGFAHFTGYISVPPRCAIAVFRSAYDSEGLLIGTLNEFVTDQQSPVRIAKDLRIPETASVGQASLYRTVQWSCNWPQRLFPRQRPITTIEFSIVPGPKANE